MLATPSRRHLARRVLWTAFLVLAVLLQPVIIAASEVHESQHLLEFGHALETDEEHGTIPADESTSGHDSAAGHALLHLGHCCGHPTALLPEIPVLAPPSLDALPPFDLAPAPPGVEPATLLRPPIVA